MSPELVDRIVYTAPFALGLAAILGMGCVRGAKRVCMRRAPRLREGLSLHEPKQDALARPAAPPARALPLRLTAGAGMTLFELRVWHWRLVMTKRALQRRHEEEYKLGASKNYHAHQAKVAGRLADFHLSCVQALNDYLPGTAEQDCAALDRFKKT